MPLQEYILKGVVNAALGQEQGSVSVLPMFVIINYVVCFVNNNDNDSNNYYYCWILLLIKVIKASDECGSSGGWLLSDTREVVWYSIAAPQESQSEKIAKVSYTWDSLLSCGKHLSSNVNSGKACRE